MKITLNIPEAEVELREFYKQEFPNRTFAVEIKNESANVPVVHFGVRVDMLVAINIVRGYQRIQKIDAIKALRAYAAANNAEIGLADAKYIVEAILI